MPNSKKLLKIGFVMLWWFALSSCVAFTHTGYAEKTYTITETQVQQLQAEFKLQRNLLQKLKNNESRLKEELNQCKAQLNLQKESLEKSKQALDVVNESFRTYSEQEKKKIRKVKMQRNIAYGIICGLIVYKLKNT